MGYCTDAYGRLCCDLCDNSGGVRRQRCPHGYCQSIACCSRPECKAKLRDYRKTHCATACKKSHAEYVAVEVDRKAKLDAGLYLRCAAVGIDEANGAPGTVRVWFRNASNQERIRYMHQDTYHAFPIGHCIDGNVTEDDYRKHGAVWQEGEDSQDAARPGFVKQVATVQELFA